MLAALVAAHVPFVVSRNQSLKPVIFPTFSQATLREVRVLLLIATSARDSAEMHQVFKHKLCIIFPCVQIPTHLYSMFIRPVKAEQCLHNVIKVVEALRHIGLDYDIQVSEDSLPTYLGSFTNLLVSMSVD